MKMLVALLGTMMTVSAMAQDHAATDKALQSRVVVIQAGICPVAISAQRQAFGQLLQASVSGTSTPRLAPGEAGPSLSVVLVAPAGKTFLQAEVALDYSVPSPGAKLAEVRAGGSGLTPFRTRRFTLDEASGAVRLERRLSLGEPGTITRLRLLSVLYTDGSSLDEPTGCSVHPSPLVLVAGQ